MTSLSSVSQQIISDDIDIDRSFQQWINNSLKKSPDLAQKINVVYRFDIRKRSGQISSWVLDLSQSVGAIYRQPKAEIKCVITIDESDLLQAIVDTRHMTKIFIQRKMTLKGPRVALEKLQQFWVEADKCNKDFKPISKLEKDKNVDQDYKTLLEPFTCTGFKSDVIFHTLKNRMHEEQDIVRKLSGIMQFEITKNNKKSIWTIDFTKPLGQNVYPGCSSQSPVCVLTMEDEDYVRMMVNKFNPQKAFMMGKMKVKGQILAIYKLFTVWVEAAFKKNRAPEVPFIEQILLKDDLIAGLKSEIIIFRVIQRLVKFPQLCSENMSFYFDITNAGKLVSRWKLDLKTDNKFGVFSREPLNVDPPPTTTIVIEDQDFALMALNKLDIEQAFRAGRIGGDINLANKLQTIFQSPIIQSRL